MGILDKYNAGAKIQGRHDYIAPGRYFARIEACKLVEKRNKSEAFVFELHILKVLNTYTDPLGDPNAQGVRPQAVASPEGITVSHMLNPSDYFEGELKEAFMNIEGITEAEASDPENGITLEYIKEAISQEQPKAGTVVEVDCVPIVTKSGGPFTKVKILRSDLPHHPKCIQEEEYA